MKTKIKTALVIILSFVLNNVYAQDVNNINKTLDIAKEQISHEEKMGYIGMAIGFILVMCIAWFSNNLAKKRELKKQEETRQRYLNTNHNCKHSSHDPYWNKKKVNVKK